MDIFPNSLMTTAHCSSFSFSLSSLMMAVVFPEPRNPEMMFTGIDDVLM